MNGKAIPIDGTPIRFIDREYYHPHAEMGQTLYVARTGLATVWWSCASGGPPVDFVAREIFWRVFEEVSDDTQG